MRTEKSLGGILRALPSVVRMEEARGLGKTFMNQWGGLGNTAKIAWKILVGGQGVISNLKDLSGFKVGRVIPNLFLGMWETFADREAVIDGEKRYTYGEMQARVLKLANALQSLGIKPKDAVASMLYNSSEFLEVFYSLSLIGATMPFVNWHLKSEELQTTINLRGPKMLVFDADFLDEIREPRFRPEGVVTGIDLEVTQRRGTLFRRFVEPFERLLFVT